MLRAKNYLLAGFILLKFVLQYLLIHPVFNLHRDEYLYIDQGKHLAWGYISVPPLISWFSYLILLLDGSEFWVKFFPALFGALTLFLVWKMVESLGGGIFALILSAIAILFSVLLRVNTLYQPNSFDILAWTALYYALLRYIQSEKEVWLYLGAVFFALGFLNKYNIAFCVIGLVPAMLFFGQAKLFARKELYISILIALAIIAPNLVWQYANGWPVIWHMRELTENQLVNTDLCQFLFQQLLFFIGSVYIILAGMWACLSYLPFRSYRFLTPAYLITMAVYVLLQGKAYYALGLYPVFIAMGSAFLEQQFAIKKLAWMKAPALILPLILFLPLIRIVFPIYTPEEMIQRKSMYQSIGLLRWEDGKEHDLQQDFADMLGWEEMANKVDLAYEEIGDQRHTLVYCDNYGQAGAVNYYSKYPSIKAVSFNADYINWFPIDTMEVKHMIMVKDIYDSDSTRSEEKDLFEEIYPSGTVLNPYAREKGTRIYILKNAKKNINKIIEAERMMYNE